MSADALIPLSLSSSQSFRDFLPLYGELCAQARLRQRPWKSKSEKNNKKNIAQVQTDMNTSLNPFRNQESYKA